MSSTPLALWTLLTSAVQLPFEVRVQLHEANTPGAYPLPPGVELVPIPAPTEALPEPKEFFSPTQKDQPLAKLMVDFINKYDNVHKQSLLDWSTKLNGTYKIDAQQKYFPKRQAMFEISSMLLDVLAQLRNIDEQMQNTQFKHVMLNTITVCKISGSNTPVAVIQLVMTERLPAGQQAAENAEVGIHQLYQLVRDLVTDRIAEAHLPPLIVTIGKNAGAKAGPSTIAFDAATLQTALNQMKTQPGARKYTWNYATKMVMSDNEVQGIAEPTIISYKHEVWSLSGCIQNSAGAGTCIGDGKELEMGKN
ncbi:hypothetical protein BGX34_006302, partial [Mortierella sp. NVP85]